MDGGREEGGTGRGIWEGGGGESRKGLWGNSTGTLKLKTAPPGRRSLRFQKVKTLPGKLLNNGFINITNPNKNNLNDYWYNFQQINKDFPPQ